MRILTLITLTAMLLTSVAAFASADHPPAAGVEPIRWEVGDGTSAPLVRAEGGMVYVVNHEEQYSIGGVDAGAWRKGASVVVGGGDVGFEDPALGIWGTGNVGYDGAGVHAWGPGSTFVGSGDADVGFDDPLLGDGNATVRGAGASSGKGILGVGSDGGSVGVENPHLAIWGTGNVGFEAAGLRVIWGTGNVGLEADGGYAWAPVLV